MFQFEIHQAPAPQKQTRFVCNCPPTAKCKKWGFDPSQKDKEQIQWQVKPFAPETPLTGPIELTIVFFLPIPKSTPKAKRLQMINRVILPAVKPDEDNLAYIVTNALKKIVYEDDALICAKHVYKFYGETPKTVIRVRSLTDGMVKGYADADYI